MWNRTFSLFFLILMMISSVFANKSPASKLDFLAKIVCSESATCLRVEEIESAVNDNPELVLYAPENQKSYLEYGIHIGSKRLVECIIEHFEKLLDAAEEAGDDDGYDDMSADIENIIMRALNAFRKLSYVTAQQEVCSVLLREYLLETSLHAKKLDTDIHDVERGIRDEEKAQVHCSYCHKEMPESSLKKHECICKKKKLKFKCPVCLLRAASTNTIKTHLNKDHKHDPRVKRLTCPDCRFILPTAGGLKIHRKNHCTER